MKTFTAKLTKVDGYNIALTDVTTNAVITNKRFQGVVAATETLKDIIFMEILKRKNTKALN